MASDVMLHSFSTVAHTDFLGVGGCNWTIEKELQQFSEASNTGIECSNRSGCGSNDLDRSWLKIQEYILKSSKMKNKVKIKYG